MGLSPALQHADVATLFLNRKHFEVYRIERDQEAIEEMARRLEDWWNRYVVADVAPPPVCEEDCKALYKRSNPGKTVEATADVLGKLADYGLAAEEERRAKERADALKSEICAFMGDAEILASPAGLAWAPRIANTAVWSEGCPGVGGGAAPVIAGGAVKGFAGSDPMLSAPLREGGGLSVPQIPVGAASDYTRNGHPVYGATAFYLHAPSVNPGSPWWNIINNDWYTEARARSSLGLDRLPRLPDAWGRERADGKIACGPLNVKTGMWLMVR